MNVKSRVPLVERGDVRFISTQISSQRGQMPNHQLLVYPAELATYLLTLLKATGKFIF